VWHEAPPQFKSRIFVNRTGVGLLLGDSQFREHIQNHSGFDFEIPGQFVDADFLHIYTTGGSPSSFQDGFGQPE